MISLLNALSTGGIVSISVFGGLFLLLIVYLCFVPLKTYFTVIFSGCYIFSGKLLGMKCRKLNVKEIAEIYISARKSKLDVKIGEIEKGMQSCENMKGVIESMTMLASAGKPISFDKALSIEIATKNIQEITKNSLVSQSIILENICATTLDGFEIGVDMNMSVKADLDKFSDALALEELKSSLSAYVVDKIAGKENHKDILSAPNKSILEGIDLQEISQKSMYKLQDVSIIKINILKDGNIEKEIKSAEKEKIYASIEAERVKNAEEVRLIQSKTKIEEMKAEVLEAEAEVPRALSNAIKEGRFSVMDYYKLMNLQADTALRRAIISDDEEGEE